MKKIFLTTLLITLGFKIIAQSKLGLKAGISFAEQEFKSYGPVIPPSSTTSFNIQGFADLTVARNFSIQPGLAITGKGYTLKTEGYTATARLFYLEVPVNAVAKLPLEGLGKIFFGWGPYANYGLTGKFKGSGLEVAIYGNSDLFSKENLYRKGDFGFNFLGGIELPQSLLVNVN